MLLLLFILYMVILLLEVPFLLQQRRRRELLVFSLVFALGVYLSLAQYFQWPLVNPLRGMLALAARLAGV
jgi:hypothetical protein